MRSVRVVIKLAHLYSEGAMATTHSPAEGNLFDAARSDANPMKPAPVSGETSSLQAASALPSAFHHGYDLQRLSGDFAFTAPGSN